MIKTIIIIEGMMCGHCEAHINDTVRKNFDVKKISSSHKNGTTEIISENQLDEEKLRSAIEADGYKVISLKSESYEKKGFSLFK